MDRQRLFEFLNRLTISELMTMLAILIKSNEVGVFGQKYIRRRDVSDVIFQQGKQPLMGSCSV
jgi:hypothetical protein